MASSLAEDRTDRAFERLYARHARDVYRYVLAVLRNPAEAEDVTQTTFLNAYRALRAGEQPLKPHNWLIAIAHNVCRSRIRFSMRRPKEVPLEVVVEQLEVPEAERPNVRELLRLLGRLPFNQRAALTMRELEGRSHVEIAETLGVTVPAAEALIGRARRALRSQAAAIRGLAVVQLPQTLRSLFARGEAAGGAVGSTAAVKAAALIAAGAVAGGVALAPDRAAPRSPAAPIAALVEATPVHAAAVSRRGRSTVHATLRRRIAAASRRARASQPPATWTGRARLDPADADSAKTAPAPAAPATGPRDGGQGGGQAASLAASAPAAPAAPTTPVSDVATAAPSAAAPVTKTVEDTLAAVQPPSLPPATPAPSVPQPPAAPTVPGP